MHEFQKVAVVGLGYIGLPTAAVIASRGIRVVGIDTNEMWSRPSPRARSTLLSPISTDSCRRSCSNGSLIATIKPEQADVFMIAVPTPIDGAKRPDLTASWPRWTALPPCWFPEIWSSSS